MFMEERHREISEALQANGKITIAEIAGKYGISDESARRDLRLLEQKGICRRTHGGALALGQVGIRPPADRDFDNMPIFENYREIARTAVQKIKENDTVYLTSGSFGHIMLSFLPRDIPYTLIVNSVDMGKALRRFSNVDLHIKSGEVIGILGGTGSSKSTLVQLIPRLYDVTEGCVKVGGIDVRKYDLEVLRNNVAVVLQKNVLFSGTIKDNLRWGNPDATDEDMLEACKLAQADEFIQQFPDKYDTWIEQGGSNVSGGQKQRLCIARALMKKPKVLILDDSTSAVDTRTDALIRQGFREFIPETTKIIIAQRVASVQDADRIIVMEGGRISDIGTHDELLNRNEIYREIYTTQNKAGDQNGEE